MTWNVRESIRRAISSRLTVPVLAGGAAIALGVLVMLGWALRLALLTSILPGAIPMQPVTALALILGGAGLVAAARPGLPGLLPNCLAGAVLLLALLDLGEFATGADFDLDALLFPAAVARQPFAMAHPGRMAEPTIFCFLLAGIPLLLVRRQGRTAALAFSASATSILLPVALTLLCYLFDAAPTPGLFGFTQVSIPTAAGLVLLAIGLLALRPDAGWMPLLLGDTVGAAAVRRLLPILILVPILVGWLAQGGMLLGFYSAGHRLAIVTALSIALLAAVTIGAATRFDRLDAILAAIANYLTVCQRLVEAGGTASRELRRALAHALASTERAAEIIRRLRDFVIKGEVHRAPHDVNAIVEDALVLALAGGVLQDAGTEADFDPAARWVLADPVQIQQVLPICCATP